MAQPIATLESQRLYSLKEFEELDLPANGNKYELIDGELRVAPPAGDNHGRIGVQIILAIGAFDPQRKLGQSWAASRFNVAPGFGPAPDMAFIAAANLPERSSGAVAGKPDLAVEVWSPGDLDTKDHRAEARAKIRRYQVAGVSLVWAVNPPARTVEVYHPNQTGPVQVLGIDDELSGEDVIPGFTMPVRALFE